MPCESGRGISWRLGQMGALALVLVLGAGSIWRHLGRRSVQARALRGWLSDAGVDRAQPAPQAPEPHPPRMRPLHFEVRVRPEPAPTPVTRSEVAPPPVDTVPLPRAPAESLAPPPLSLRLSRQALLGSLRLRASHPRAPGGFVDAEHVLVGGFDRRVFRVSDQRPVSGASLGLRQVDVVVGEGGGRTARVEGPTASPPHLVGLRELSFTRDPVVLPRGTRYGVVWGLPVPAAVSEDGRRVAIPSRYDEQVDVLPLVTGLPRVVIPMAGSPVVLGMAFSPDSEVLALVTTKSVSVHRTRDGVRVGSYSTGRSLGLGVAFHPDGRSLFLILQGDAGNGDADQVAHWHLGRSVGLAFPGRRGERVEALAVSPDGRWMAVQAGARSALVDLRDHGIVPPLEPGPSHVDDLHFAPDGRHLLASSRGGQAIWALPSGKLRGRPLLHAGEVRSLAFSADGLRLASTGGGRAVHWDLAALRPLSVFDGCPCGDPIGVAPDLGPEELGMMLAQPDLSRLDAPPTYGLRDIPARAPLPASLRFEGSLAYAHEHRETAVARSGKILVAVEAGDSWGLRLAGQDRTSPVKVLPLDGQHLDAWSLADAGNRVAILAPDLDEVRVHDAWSGEVLRRVAVGRDSVAKVALSGDGETLALVGPEGSTRVLGVDDGAARVQLELGTAVDRVELSGDGSRLTAAAGTQLVVASLDGTPRITIRETRTKRHGSPIRVLAFSPDAARVAVGHGDGMISVFAVGVP